MAFHYIRTARNAEALLHRLLKKRSFENKVWRELRCISQADLVSSKSPRRILSSLFRLNAASLNESEIVPGRIWSYSDDQGSKSSSEDNSSKGKRADDHGPQFDKDALILSTIIIAALIVADKTSSSKEITYRDFINNYLGKEKIDSIGITRYGQNQRCVVKFSEIRINRRKEVWFHIGNADAFEQKLEQAQNQMGIPQDQHFTVRNIMPEKRLSQEDISMIPLYFLGWLILYRTAKFGKGIARFPSSSSSPYSSTTNKMSSSSSSSSSPMKNQSNVLSMLSGSSNVKVVKSDVKFKNVVGCDEAKAEIMEFVSFLKYPSQYHDLGAKIPKGAILTGPPGTGKTLLAKATAGEADVPFIYASGSDFTEIYVGVGPSRVRDMFALARAEAPSILFIDEIDAVGRSRSTMGDVESSNTVNELLVQMDGIKSEKDVIVLAATNRIDTLDKALLRAGRFDRQIYVGHPDIRGREELFELYLKELKSDLDKKELAKKMSARTAGFTGADIAALCNEAALITAREAKDNIGMEEFERATDRVVAGLEKKSTVLSPEEKRTVAYHEAGHAVAGWFLEHTDPLQKVTIIPTAQSLGYAMFSTQDIYLMSKEQINDRICVGFGGRVAEEIFFNKVTSGAEDDLDKVTRMAYIQMTKSGMGEKTGLVAWHKTLRSDEIADTIDREVRELLTSLYGRTKDLLLTHKDAIEKLAQILILKEKIDRDVLVEVLGKRPFAEAVTYEEIMKKRADTE